MVGRNKGVKIRYLTKIIHGEVQRSYHMVISKEGLSCGDQVGFDGALNLHCLKFECGLINQLVMCILMPLLIDCALSV